MQHQPQTGPQDGIARAGQRQDSDNSGRPHDLLWTGQRRLEIPDLSRFEIWRAVRQAAGLAQAVQLVNDTPVGLARGKTRPVYCHILCREHAVLRANGLAVVA